MKIAICDDDVLFAKHLEALINQYVVAEGVSADVFVFDNAADFLNSNLKEYDLVL